ncbi:MAG: hypothetical protein AB7O90_05645 [Hyphomicrobium sp.]
MFRFVFEVARHLTATLDGAAHSITVRVLRMCTAAPKSTVDRRPYRARAYPKL